MRAEIVAHDLQRRLSSIVVAGASLAVLAMFGLSIYGSFADTAASLVDSFPEALRALYGADLDVPGGIFTAEYLNLIAPFVVIGVAVGFGARTIAGEEREGTLSLLLASPVSRTQVVLSKAVVLVAIVLGVSTLTWAGLLGSGLLTEVDLPPGDVLAATVHLVALGLAVGMWSLALSAATGRQGVAVGVPVGVSVASWLGVSLLPLIDVTGPVRLLPWHYYNGSEPILNGVDVGHVLVLVVLAAVGLGVAVWGIEHRDLKG